VNVPGESTISGRIRKISRSVNPSTRLIDVFVLLPSSTDFLLGEMVVGTIAIASARGWVVPRSCVLPADGRFVLYTVKDGRASRHIVDVGLENEKEVEVFSKDLQAGDRVVALGNYELSDGMSVQVVGSP
jgi:membrane fusion protein (multidrug efflux system)